MGSMAEIKYQKPVKQADMETMLSMIAPMIEQGKSVKLTVTGYSMYPLVSSRRDAVMLKKCGSLKVGDVPLIRRSDGSYILHRIVKEREGAFAVMGDYEIKEEYPVYPEQVIAVATGFYRKGRYISCDSFLYRAYSVFWRHTRAIRPFLLKTAGKMARKKSRYMKKRRMK